MHFLLNLRHPEIIFSGHKADFLFQFITNVEFSEQKMGRTDNLVHYLFPQARLRQEALMCPPRLHPSSIWWKKKKGNKTIKLFAGSSQVGMKESHDRLENSGENTRVDPNPHLSLKKKKKANISAKMWGKMYENVLLMNIIIDILYLLTSPQHELRIKNGVCSLSLKSSHFYC